MTIKRPGLTSSDHGLDNPCCLRDSTGLPHLLLKTLGAGPKPVVGEDVLNRTA